MLGYKIKLSPPQSAQLAKDVGKDQSLSAAVRPRVKVSEGVAEPLAEAKGLLRILRVLLRSNLTGPGDKELWT